MLKKIQSNIKYAVITLILLVSFSTSSLAVFEHVGCSGAESPIIQSAIHNHDINQLSCLNYTPGEVGDGITDGHEQTCTNTYGPMKWASVDCNYGSAAGCDASANLYCAGSFVTAHVHCPPNSAGPASGLMPQARSNGSSAWCSYTDSNGTHQKTCSCSDSSGCS